MAETAPHTPEYNMALGRPLILVLFKAASGAKGANAATGQAITRNE